MRIRKIPVVENQHYPETQSVLGTNAFPGSTSSPRKQMNANNLGQLVVVNGLSERMIQTGIEVASLAETTFSIKMPGNGRVLAVIPRYNNRKEGLDTIKENPQTVVVYEDTDTGEIGMVNLTEYCSFHPYIGWKYEKNEENLAEIFYKNFIKKGTKFLDSPGVTKNGEYRYGVMANVAMMTHPATSEDGILINEDVLHKFAFRTYETRVVEYGTNSVPLNIYGDDENFKAYPDIGEYIHGDGLLMVLRTFDPKNKKHVALSPVEMSKNALRRADFLFDKPVYVAGAGGRVIDIRINHDVNTGQPGTPPTMEAQSIKYDNARREFYEKIYQLNRKLESERGSSLNLSKEFHRLCVEAISVVGPPDLRAQKVNKKVPLDDWHITFVIEYINIPNIGNKFTDDYGGKGVVCRVGKREEMPVDEHGNVADFVFDPGSTINRMIISRLYEQYINAASRDVLRSLTLMLGVNRETHRTKGTIQKELTRIEMNEPARFKQAWDYLLGYYAITVPAQHAVFAEGRHGATPLGHLTHVINEGYLVLHIRTDHPLEYKNMVADIEEFYPPLWGPVKYIDPFGNHVTTREKIRIGPMHILMLEKIADSWSAVSTATTQHYGVLATMSNQDKYSKPIRHNPTRAFGEAEIRILLSYAGGRVAAEILDRNNNLAAHKEIVRSILRAEKPTNIDVAVDRQKVPLGGARPLQLVKHIAQCGGWAFAYKPFQPNWQYDGSKISAVA